MRPHRLHPALLSGSTSGTSPERSGARPGCVFPTRLSAHTGIPPPAGGIRSNFRLHAFRQSPRDTCEIFQRSRPRPINVGALIKHHVHIGEPEVGDARTAFTRGAPVMVEIMGYVTWSSMMSGLRSQRETMMTWVSLRSGVASSGRCIMAQAPKRQAMPTRANTRNLFLTEKLMTRLIIGASRAVESSGTPPLCFA